jgi:hypothetical protein
MVIPSPLLLSLAMVVVEGVLFPAVCPIAVNDDNATAMNKAR